MLRLLSILLCLLTMQVSAQEKKPEVEVVVSKTHGLFYMVECLLDVPHRNSEMASTFRGRIGNWGPVEDQLNDWQEHLTRANDSRLKFPPVDGRVPSLGEVLESAALDSENIEEFAARASIWLKPDASESFEKLLKILAPHYDRYWWSPSSLEQRRQELTKDLAKGQFGASFDKAKAFYRGELPGEGLPKIALIPYLKGILSDADRTMGHNSGSLQVLEVIVGEPDSRRAGICFHEFTHGLWLGQDEAERIRWEQSFAKRGLPGLLAYGQLNEGLATAIGNGWFHKRVTGHIQEGNWYADPTIDSYGKELLPIVESALEQARPPSDLELESMARAFERAVPDATTKFDVVAGHFGMVSSKPEARQSQFVEQIFQLGPVRHFSGKLWRETSTSRPTFQVYWLNQDELPQLLSRGWTHRETQEFKHHSLRLTPSGWELAFLGDGNGLISLLKELQKTELKTHFL